MGPTAPQALPLLAQKVGLAAIALTDHDTTAGLAACAEGCAALGLGFVPGIELSADRTALDYRSVGSDRDPAHGPRGTLHILGLFIHTDDPALAKIEQQTRLARAQRNPQIIACLQEQGIRINYQQVLDLVQAQQGGVVGRPHIAQVLVNMGYAKSVQDAFNKYLGHGRPGYVRKDHLSPRQAIEAIHHAGGIAVLAHPVQLRCVDSDELELAVKHLSAMGLDGIEVYHSDHTPADVEQYSRLAEKYNLHISGGSDYHGSRKAIAMGSQHVPFHVYESLRQARQPESSRM
ncbi:MAG: PHP domain-containing protein [Phycisphaerales bacterium]|nr:PHP domain-containing protein [Phycisphaerales bacterium]